MLILIKLLKTKVILLKNAAIGLAVLQATGGEVEVGGASILKYSFTNVFGYSF